jgi:hypothetical protein
MREMTFTKPTGTWTVKACVVRDWPYSAILLTVHHADTGGEWTAARHGNSVPAVAGRTLAEQVDWVADGNDNFNPAVCMARTLLAGG